MYSPEKYIISRYYRFSDNY